MAAWASAWAMRMTKGTWVSFFAMTETTTKEPWGPVNWIRISLSLRSLNFLSLKILLLGHLHETFPVDGDLCKIHLVCSIGAVLDDEVELTA